MILRSDELELLSAEVRIEYRRDSNEWFGKSLEHIAETDLAVLRA